MQQGRLTFLFQCFTVSATLPSCTIVFIRISPLKYCTQSSEYPYCRFEFRIIIFSAAFEHHVSVVILRMKYDPDEKKISKGETQSRISTNHNSLSNLPTFRSIVSDNIIPSDSDLNLAHKTVSEHSSVIGKTHFPVNNYLLKLINFRTTIKRWITNKS